MCPGGSSRRPWLEYVHQTCREKLFESLPTSPSGFSEHGTTSAALCEGQALSHINIMGTPWPKFTQVGAAGSGSREKIFGGDPKSSLQTSMHCFEPCVFTDRALGACVFIRYRLSLAVAGCRSHSIFSTAEDAERPSDLDGRGARVGWFQTRHPTLLQTTATTAAGWAAGRSTIQEAWSATCGSFVTFIHHRHIKWSHGT